MADRTELEDAIFDTAKRTRDELEQVIKRLDLAIDQMEREVEGSARIVPENQTLRQDLYEIGAVLWDMDGDWEALIQNWEDLMETIEADREEREQLAEKARAAKRGDGEYEPLDEDEDDE